MKIFFKRNAVYLIVSLLMIITACAVLFMSSKVGGHMAVNATHTPLQDTAFFYITYGGDGLFVLAGIIVLSIIYWKRYRFSILLLSSINLIVVGALVAFFKHIVFSDAFRPIRFIGREDLYLIPDAPINLANSFPSGHTTAAFAFFALIAFLFAGKRWIQVLCAFLAGLVGYSRIYLSQHFLEDVIAGALLGLLCFIMAYFIVRPMKLKNNLTH